MAHADVKLSLRNSTGLNLSGHEALLLEPAWSDPSDFLDINQDIIEGRAKTVKPVSNTGPTVVDSDGGRYRMGKHRWTGNYLWRPFNHRRIYEFWDTMRYRMGRVRSFWMPSWCSDFTLLKDADPADSDVLYVRPNGFEWVFEPRRYGVMIETFDRFLDIYECVGYDPVSGCLFIQGTIQTKIPLASVAKVSLVRRCRADSGSTEWRYTTDAVAEVSMSVREVPYEGTFV